MADLNRIRIKAFDDKSKYTLWQIRVLATMSAKELDWIF